MARSKYEFPPLEALDVSDMWEGVDGFDQIINKAQVTEMGIGALAGAGGVLLTSLVVPMLPAMVSDSKLKRGGLAVLLGLAGGRALWNVNRDAAIGLASTVAGMGIASVIGDLTGMKVGLDGLGEDDGDDGDLYMDLSDPVVGSPMLGDASVETAFSAVDDEELLGLGMGGFDDAVVETDNNLGSFLGG